MKFSEIIESLEHGKCVARKSWENKEAFVYKQIPATIFGHKIDLLQSMPQSAKDLICKGNNVDKSVNYVDQCNIVNGDRIDSWCPNISDVFAKDWYIVEYHD